MPDTADPTVSSTEETKKLRWGVIVIVVVSIFFVAILASGMFNSRVDRPEPGDIAPDFEMQFFDGYEWQDMPTANLSDFQGHPVVLNFWASWCVECIREAKLLEDLSREYQEQGVVFLGIAYIDVEHKSLEYLEDYSVTYPNAPDLRTVISDKYDITGVPETFFIDKNGVVEYVQLSAVNENMVRSLVDKMLAAEGPESS
jgi:cytochrome c biogenesis protein CcmG/thiol:disulfide interchange protein DsbE